jgi:phosphoglycolate phosphatase-like HAD superfamily hydrolase
VPDASSGTRLILWDVDHTLMTSGGMGRDLYSQAFLAVTGRALEHMPEMAGRTERAIALEAFALHGIEGAEVHLPAFVEALAAAHTARVHLLRERGHAMPGAPEVLAALHRRPGVIQSLLTGNLPPIALEKLEAFELDQYVDFEVGAYGADDLVRGDLVAKARMRVAEKYGLTFDAETTVLVGDTPNDVAAGQAGGARVVAVATGYDIAQLTEAGADVVLPDLRDTPAVVRTLLGES